MNALLIYPEFPDTFWSFRHALKFIGKKSAFPPLGLLTISSMLPKAWNRRLIDMNVRPLTIADLTPGEHSVALTSDRGTVKQSVTIEAGNTASLVVPMTAPDSAPLSGWISVSAPVAMQLYENKRLLGSSDMERLMVTAGKHEIEIVSEVLGYRATRTVQVPPGKVAPIKLEMPKGTIALNAIPWAEVWIDGEKVGETPIGNLTVAIGPHEIVFRHPDLGEQKHAATVTLNATARLSVDLRKK